MTETTKDQNVPAAEEVPEYDHTLTLTSVESQYVRLAREEHNRLKAEAQELATKHQGLIATANQALAAAVENSISEHDIDLTPGTQVSIINDKDGVPAALVWNEPLITDTPETQAAEEHATTGKKTKKKAKKKRSARRGCKAR